MSAEWDDLARLAEAATPGPWEHDGYAGIDSEGSPSWIAHLVTHDPGEGSGNPRWRADAEFIAAANPATILRLIADNRNLRHTTEADLEYQRRLEARLAAVEALVAEWERVQKQNRKALGELARGTSHLLLDTPGPADFRAALADGTPRYAGSPGEAADRAALSAAPTDTTKEN